MSKSQQLQIGVIAPPWLPVPPTEYGGTELVLDALCRGLRARGHEVQLFTLGSSTCNVPTQWLFDTVDPDRMGASVLELRHVARAYDALEGSGIIHDHTLAGLFLSQLHPGQAVVATNHGPFDDDLADLYGRAASTVPIIAISHDQASRAPAGLPIRQVIHHGLDLARYTPGPGSGDYLVALGRMSPDKGIETAIHVARRVGMDLLIAAKMREPAEERYFKETIEPLLGNGIDYVGEVGHADKVTLLQGAHALINPIQWPEPFGLVMIEAMACGTPVVGTPGGAAPEIVDQGTTGFLGRSVEELVRGVEEVDSLDRGACRARVEEHFSMERMARDHEALFRSVLGDCGNGLQISAAVAKPIGLPPAGRRHERSRKTLEARPSIALPPAPVVSVTRD
ncbi:MAG: glycosyltransferase family 4 protein [Acidimicrobiales bacterium]